MYGRVLAAVAAAVLAAALVTGNVLLVRLAYVLWGVLVVAGVLTASGVRWLEVSRHTRARRAQVGDLAEEVFRVTNRSWLPKLWLEVVDHSDLPGHRASRVISALGPGGSRSWTARTLCRRRGMYTLGPLTLASGDPLGLFRLERELPQTVSFIVYPRTVPLAGLELPTGYLSGGQVVRRRAQFATTNVRGVRQYQPGDAFGRIHWPTTARRGRLYTKEFELDPFADFWLVVDLDRQVHLGQLPEVEHELTLPWLEPEPKLPPTTEEYAVAASASLARHFLGQGKSVGLIAHGQRRVVIRPDRGQRQLTKVLASLAVLRARGRASLAEVLATENHEFTRHTTLLVVTPTTSLSWIDALRELQHRGVATLAVVIEARTFGSAAPSDGVLSTLIAHSIPVRQIACGADLSLALSR